MSTRPTLDDDELLDLLELEHPLTSKEVGILTGMHPIEAHNRLMLLYGLSGCLESHPGENLSSGFGGLTGRTGRTGRGPMPEEEASLSLGDTAFPVLQCDCDRVFLERNAYLVHRSSCPDFEGDTEDKPRRIRERRVIELEGRVDSRAGRGTDGPQTKSGGGR